ncbi:GCN5-related N-acetyltransferase [Oceanithermus profundus DSM 14977]|uniref:GCN5-related N-acetyltransferase n=1 Tax=Oceanithermus profundus (strain DSM 14977 / NBRC 100410 / VKM B-2274 / 506) TaxID=670487 RepID=E4U554_OCEP5|nr:GNAT family protein [Oceanithermus profundus]ADR37466.1 GCN5-related N-acetyltransferase [Oceanithermus profundus DSM 14977]
MLREDLGAGLELALAVPQHAEALFELIDAGREHLRRWLPFVDTTRDVDHTRAFLKDQLRELAEGRALTLVLFHHGRAVGVLGLNRVDAVNRVASVGYWLAEDATGQGLMTRAVRRLVELAFAHFPVDRIEIHCAVDNRASCAIPERLGFTREAVLRRALRAHEFVDDRVVWGLLREEWEG